MKNNWEKKQLGDILKLEYGKPLDKKYRKQDGRYPIYGANGIKGWADKYYYNKSSIIVGRKGSAGAINLTEPYFWPLDVTYFVKFDDKKYNLKFLFHLLNKLDLTKLAIGVKPGINRYVVYSKFVLVPPLPQQKCIVEKLDKAFAAIAKANENTEKNLKNARELFESYLQDIFNKPNEGWAKKLLKEIGNITSSKRIYKREYTKNGIPFYRIKEIKELANKEDISIELFISNERYEEIKKTFGVPNICDVLITAVGTIGEIYVVENKTKFYFKDGNVLWLKDFNSVNPYFLKFILMYFVEKIRKLSQGAAYNALTIEKLEKHQIYVPSISEQELIVKKINLFVTEIKKLENIYQSKILLLEELKQSILQKAFNGELNQ
jgi:type I restriction enzyme S subunit